MNAPRQRSTTKPLGQRSYGSIGHLPGSRLGPTDSCVSEQQAEIATGFAPPGHVVIVQEKLDGSNVGVARVDGLLVALTRAGYLCSDSPHKQHHAFADWVRDNHASFGALLPNNGDRVCGEWLALAHGTRYALGTRSPFVAFDMFRGEARLSYDAFTRVATEHGFAVPKTLHIGAACPLEWANAALGKFGHYGAIDPAEGLVYRVEKIYPTGTKGEREQRLAFITKYVRAAKVDGCYLVPNEPVWNWRKEAA